MSEVGSIPIVDTHQHLWDLDRFRLPWLAGAPRLNRSYLIKDYDEAVRGLNVVKSIYMEVDVEPTQHADEAAYVSGVCAERKSTMVAAVISGRPASAEFDAYIRPLARNRQIKGLRQVLHGSTPAGYCVRTEFVRGIRLLGELGLSFDLCMRGGELMDGARLADACPGTRFILDHCGNPDVRNPAPGWKEGIQAVAKRPNVICKISGIVASADPEKWTPADLRPFVLHCLDSFGPDRVVFGGDWPVCTLAASYRRWVEALFSIIADRPAVEQRKLLHDNAVRFYGIS